MNTNTTNDPLCLVLSGGGIRGYGLLGSLQYLSEQRELDALGSCIGTSIGAIIAYLLCLGYSPLDIVHYSLRNQVLQQLSNLADAPQSLISGNGLIQFEPISEFLEVMTLSKHGRLFTFQTLYDECSIDFGCVTYNYNKLRTEVLHRSTTPDLSCIQAIQMSASIPYVFEQCLYQGNVYIDGGLVDNFPLRAAFRLGETRVIGIVTMYTKCESELSLWTVLTLSVFENTKRSIRKYRKRTTIVTVPGDYHVLDFGVDLSTVMEMFSEGYRAAKAQLGGA